MERLIHPFLRGWMEATGSQHMRTRVGVASAALPVPAATAPHQENHKIKFSIKKKCLGRCLCQSGEGCPSPRGLEQDTWIPTATWDMCHGSSPRASLSTPEIPGCSHKGAVRAVVMNQLAQ